MHRRVPFARRALVALLVAGLAVAASGCGKSNPVAPQAAAKPLLVLGDDSTQDSVMAILAASGIPAAYGGPYYSFDGAGLDQYSAILFLTGKVYSRVVHAEVQRAIRDYVAAGGGLMTIEWLGYSKGRGYYDLIADIAPVQFAGDSERGSDFYVIQNRNHPITRGLPPSFATPGDDWGVSMLGLDLRPQRQAVSIVTGMHGVSVAAGVYGAGRTVHWNMAGHYYGRGVWNANVRRLLANIADYVAKRS